MKIISNPTTHNRAELPDAVDVVLDPLDEFAPLKKLAEFETALVIALTGLFRAAGMKELFAALFDMDPMFGIAGIILFIF